MLNRLEKGPSMSEKSRLANSLMKKLFGVIEDYNFGMVIAPLNQLCPTYPKIQILA